ncbi:MAG: hypothetical protein AB7U75_04940 [Hyphomicrobiaceae bacterium]
MLATNRHLIQKGAFAAAAFAVLAVPTAHAGDDCRAAVEAAFDKQRTFATGYRFAAEIPGDQGKTRMTIDYLPPDRMYQRVEAPGHEKPVETIAIQRWAWGTMGGGWEELQPQFAQSIIAHVRSTLINPPKITTEFSCLGKVKLGDKDLVAYRADHPSSEAGSAPGTPQLARTIYVDGTSGLPVANIVARVDGKEGAVFDGRYTYPADIKIEPPVGGHDIEPTNATRN